MECVVTTKTFNVPDMSCDHCVRAITTELSAIQGVAEVNVDLDQKTVTLTIDETVTDDQIVAGLDEAGFDVAV